MRRRKTQLSRLTARAKAAKLRRKAQSSTERLERLTMERARSAQARARRSAAELSQRLASQRERVCQAWHCAIMEKPDMSVVKQESTITICGVKEEIIEHEWRDMDRQRCVQAASTTAIAGSVNVAAGGVAHGGLLHIKGEPRDELGDEDLDIGPTVLQHMDSCNRRNQNASVVTEDNMTAGDANDPILCNRVEEGSAADNYRGLLMPQGNFMEVEIHEERLEPICGSQLRRLDTFLGFGPQRSSHWHMEPSQRFNGRQQFATETVFGVQLKRLDTFLGSDPQTSSHRQAESPQRSNGSHQCARVPEPSIYICDYCQKTFTLKNSFICHITCVHASGSYKCSPCNKSFRCEQYLMRHNANVHYDKYFNNLHSRQSAGLKCSPCNKSFRCEQYLMRHNANVHFDKHFNNLPGQQSAACPGSHATSDLRPRTIPESYLIAVDMSAEASTSTQQRDAMTVKEEPADGELELGPVVFQHMDCNN